MEKIIYSKYSNDRRRAFAIRTDICVAEDGQKCVYKSALFPEGKKHMEMMYQHYIDLCKIWAGTGFEVVECRKTEEMGIRFEYLDGKTLDVLLDQLLEENRMEELENILLDYVKKINNYSSGQLFVSSDSFEHVFGKVDLPSDLKSALVTNVDMIVSNAFVVENGYKVIDHEWVFDFPIPANYVIFRVLYYYMNSSSRRQVLNARNLYEKANITKEEMEVYIQMEKTFQQYILGDRVKYNDFYSTISPGIEAGVNKFKGVYVNNLSKTDRMLHVFYSENEDMGEKDSVYIRLRDESSVHAALEIDSRVRVIRLDPGEHACVVEVKSLMYNGKSIFQDSISGNWNWRKGWKFYFATTDPQLIFNVCGGGMLEVEMSIYQVSDMAADILGNEFNLRQQKIDRLSRELEENKAIIYAIENTKTWKMHEKCCKMIKRGKKNE